MLDGSQDIDDLERQFALVRCCNENYALPLTTLREIIRVPDIVHVPMAPPALMGFANLRGTILPVIDPAKLLGDNPLEESADNRILVCEASMTVGLAVTSMDSIIRIDFDKIEPVDAKDTSGEQGLVSSILRHDDRLHMVLSIENLLERAFASLQKETDNVGSGTLAPRLDQNAFERKSQAEQASRDEELYLTFSLGNEEFGIQIDVIDEIFQRPTDITPLPHAPKYLPAVIPHREKLLHLVELAQLLNIKNAEGISGEQIIVTEANVDTKKYRLGLLAEAVKEVLPIGKNNISPVPYGLQRNDTNTGISSVCQIDGGKRTISIIDLPEMVSMMNFDEVRVDDTELESDIMVESQLAENSNVNEFLIVIFRIANEEYGVAIEYVQEIISQTSPVTRLPNAPAWLAGVVNFRGSVLPMVDTRLRFDIQSQSTDERSQVVVLAKENTRCGFIVDSITEVLSISRDTIGEAPTLSDETIPMVREVVNLPEEQRMILLLDGAEMLDASSTNTLETKAVA